MPGSAPTDEEWEHLIRDWVLDEVYYREALALGLNKDDLIISRRLRRRMAFVSEGLATPAEPSDVELQSYLDAHAAAYAGEPRFSFRQVYLDSQRHGAGLARDGERLLARLNAAGAAPTITTLGDPLPLQRELRNASAREVCDLFGRKFVAALEQPTPRRWHGPIESGYGVHLVFLAEHLGGGAPPLDAGREAERRDWADARQGEAADRFQQGMLRKYRMTIEAVPATAAAMPGSAASR